MNNKGCRIIDTKHDSEDMKILRENISKQQEWERLCEEQPTSKFKVGDIIVVNRGQMYGWKFEVISITDTEYILLNLNKNHPQYGQEFHPIIKGWNPVLELYDSKKWTGEVVSEIKNGYERWKLKD